VLIVHPTADGTEFLDDDQVLTAAEFHDERIVPLGLGGQPVILVACNGMVAALELVRLLRGPVVAADNEVFTMPDASVVARGLLVSSGGVLVPGVASQFWLIREDESRQGLGPDVQAAIRSGTLTEKLGRPVTLGEVPAGLPRLAQPVRWSGQRGRKARLAVAMGAAIAATVAHPAATAGPAAPRPAPQPVAWPVGHQPLPASGAGTDDGRASLTPGLPPEGILHEELDDEELDEEEVVRQESTPARRSREIGWNLAVPIGRGQEHRQPVR
jgi:hypothetical protein